MRISYEYYSQAGKRKNNEDYYGIAENEATKAYLFAVADGAGTQLGAKMAVDTLTQIFPKEDGSQKLLPGLFQLAERMLLKMEEKQNLPARSFRTTLAALQLDVTNHSFLFAHQGDTRIYVFRDGRLFTRTKDHSVAQKMVSNGQMPEISLRNSEEKNQITRLLGVGLKNPWEASDLYELRDQMSFLICTDGFWNDVLENEMEETLQTSEFVGEWLAKMKKIALERGCLKKMDNHTAIAIFAREE